MHERILRILKSVANQSYPYPFLQVRNGRRLPGAKIRLLVEITPSDEEPREFYTPHLWIERSGHEPVNVILDQGEPLNGATIGRYLSHIRLPFDVYQHAVARAKTQELMAWLIGLQGNYTVGLNELLSTQSLHLHLPFGPGTLRGSLAFAEASTFFSLRSLPRRERPGESLAVNSPVQS